GSTGDIEFLRADGAGTADPTQQVLIKNLDVNRALPIGLKIAGVSGGNVTTAIDLTDSNIGIAIALGANNVSATHFSLTGSSGNIQANGTLTVDGASTLTGNITSSGDLALNGSDITTTSVGTATLFNTNATTVNIAGAGTTVSLGAGSGTTTVNNDLAVTGV